MLREEVIFSDCLRICAAQRERSEEGVAFAQLVELLKRKSTSDLRT